METMNSTLLWILVAIVVIALIVLGIVLVGNSRRKSKTVSFEKPEDEAPKQLTQQEKSGNYQAKGGFSFAPADAAAPSTASREPVRVDAPIEPDSAQDDGSTALTQLNEQLDAQSAAEAESEPAVTEVETTVETNVVKDTPDLPVTPEVNKPVDERVVGEKSATEDVREDTAEVVAADNAVVDDDTVNGAPTQDEVAQEAEEAAGAAAVTVDGADSALQPGAEASPDAVVNTPEAEAPIDDIAPAAGRIGKLRGRLSRSQNAIGQGLLGILTAGDLDEDAWEEIEDTLIMADLGTQLTLKVTESLREKIAERGVSNEPEARAMLRETLIEAGRPEMDRAIKAMPNDGKPAVILVVGVNGTGKTTTTGKLARVLVSMGHSVVLGAADTFRAAAADQLETWGRRVGASTVRGKEGADPASVAFDAVATGVDQGADVVLIDTAGRLHTATGLMDQLGKVKRVVEKKSHVDEVLLVLDATVGQNGITQARVFREVVDITGVVLTKLDGTAKGGIVFQVQEELGVPVKLVGLGEGADDLAPFEVESFVDAMLG